MALEAQEAQGSVNPENQVQLHDRRKEIRDAEEELHLCREAVEARRTRKIAREEAEEHNRAKQKAESVVLQPWGQPTWLEKITEKWIATAQEVPAPCRSRSPSIHTRKKACRAHAEETPPPSSAPAALPVSPSASPISPLASLALSPPSALPATQLINPLPPINKPNPEMTSQWG